MTPEKKPELKEEMTNEEILTKALERASANGFTLDKGLWEDEEFYRYYANSLAHYQIIFSHDFAKAFWGDEWVDEYGCTFKEHKKRIKEGWHYPIDYEWYNRDFAWGFHLKGMVLHKDPLQYLTKFL